MLTACAHVLQSRNVDACFPSEASMESFSKAVLCEPSCDLDFADMLIDATG